MAAPKEADAGPRQHKALHHNSRSPSKSLPSCSSCSTCACNQAVANSDQAAAAAAADCSERQLVYKILLLLLEEARRRRILYIDVLLLFLLLLQGPEHHPTFTNDVYARQTNSRTAFCLMVAVQG